MLGPKNPCKHVVLALLCAALTCIAGVGSAGAASWHVGGTELTGSTALVPTAQVDSVAEVVVPAVKLKLACSGTSLKSINPEITNKNKAKTSGITFEGCKTTEPTTGCEMEGTTIVSVPLESTAISAASPSVRLQLTPQTKKILTEVAFKETNTCALTGVEPVKGAVTFNMPTGQTEQSVQVIEGLGSVENNSLEVAGNKAFLVGGKTLSRLASGAVWAFR